MMTLTITLSRGFAEPPILVVEHTWLYYRRGKLIRSSTQQEHLPLFTAVDI